jgi:hypothetical protein
MGKTILSVLMVCCLTDVACSEGKSGSSYDVTHRRLDQIPAGTVIGKEAPKGWSDLIIKSYTRPGAGDVGQLSPTADRLARLLFTALLADVKPGDGDRHKLAKVAVGLGVRIDGKDTVVTPDTQKRLGANLGLLARVVLSTAQEMLAETTVVARSDTLMVFDSPSYLAVDGRHQAIALRYAVLVEERTGRLNTLVWVLGRQDGGRYTGPIGAALWLPPNLTDDCVLHVDGSEFSLGQPTEKAFAMTTPPKGKEVPVAEDWKSLAASEKFTAAAAAALENLLREALRKADEK